MPEAYAELLEILRLLERHYRDMQDVEFTIEDGKLWMLQCRTGKRTGIAAVRIAVDLVREYEGVDVDLATIPQEDEVYDLLCAADTVGVFQVESRAQMATLPRLRPRNFYDLVVEVALIRPGPIQGGSVHPYMRRRLGDEPPDLPHESMRRALGKTFGVPLFQEQMMQLAVDCAGFSPAEADQLRLAMSSKRGPERIEELRGRLLAGMAAGGIPGEVGEDIYAKILAFSSYGFPESHAISFAYLVYASAWLKRYYPAAFTAALLRAQPMGFYSPASLIGDARRHGVHVRGVDVNASAVAAILEEPESPETGMPGAAPPPAPAATPGPVAGERHGPPAGGGAVPGQPVIRLGLAGVAVVVALVPMAAVPLATAQAQTAASADLAVAMRWIGNGSPRAKVGEFASFAITATNRGPDTAVATVLSIGDIELDREKKRVSRASRPIELGPTEFRLLEYLMKHAGQVVTRTMLLENVWDYHFDPQTNVIDVHISRLRSKIDKGFSQQLLHTVRGAGYMIRDGR